MSKMPPSIIESINAKLLGTAFSSVSDRYYLHKYYTKFSTPECNLDQRISFHTNRICMVSLADNHPIIKGRKQVTRIDCKVDSKTDRFKNSPSGKGKRGAQRLDVNSVLCFVECSDGTRYPVYSCMNGKLLEINESLIENPQLLVEKPVSEGYIALLLPVLKEYEAMKSAMLDREEYLLLKKEEN